MKVSIEFHMAAGESLRMAALREVGSTLTDEELTDLIIGARQDPRETIARVLKIVADRQKVGPHQVHFDLRGPIVGVSIEPNRTLRDVMEGRPPRPGGVTWVDGENKS